MGTRGLQINIPPKNSDGFTLVELTIALIIITLLSTGLMIGASAQRENLERADAQHQLDNIREALLGFAIAKGRLPCPAKPSLANTETNAGSEDCSQEHGVVPWVTLSLPESDPWGNRFSYFAGSAFTGIPAGGALASFSLTSNGTADVKDCFKNRPDGSLCGNIAAELPAVIVSHGSKASGAYQTSGNKLAGSSSDEGENSDADLTFIAHAPSENFDDLITWIVPSILKSRMLAAGRLP